MEFESGNVCMCRQGCQLSQIIRGDSRLWTVSASLQRSRLEYENNLNAKSQSLPFPVGSNFEQ